MKANLLEQARTLSIDDQIELVEALWDHIADHDAVPPPTKPQLDELERRLQRHLLNPDEVMTLEEVTATLTNSLHK